MEIDVNTLHPLEIKAIKYYADKNVGEISSSSLMRDLGFIEGQANQVISWLSFRQILNKSREELIQKAELTPYGLYSVAFHSLEHVFIFICSKGNLSFFKSFVEKSLSSLEKSLSFTQTDLFFLGGDFSFSEESLSLQDAKQKLKKISSVDLDFLKEIIRAIKNIIFIESFAGIISSKIKNLILNTHQLGFFTIDILNIDMESIVKPLIKYKDPISLIEELDVKTFASKITEKLPKTNYFPNQLPVPDVIEKELDDLLKRNKTISSKENLSIKEFASIISKSSSLDLSDKNKLDNIAEYNNAISSKEHRMPELAEDIEYIIRSTTTLIGESPSKSLTYYIKIIEILNLKRDMKFFIEDLNIEDLASDIDKQIDRVFGFLKQEGIANLENGIVTINSDLGIGKKLENWQNILLLLKKRKEIDGEQLKTLDKRFYSKDGKNTALKLVEQKIAYYKFDYEVLHKLSKQINRVVEGAIGNLTREMLINKTYKGKEFRDYGRGVFYKETLSGKRNPYSLFLEHVKDKLTHLGFKEFDSDMVTTEFWNSDALFMPQFHAARGIHDVYRIKEPTHIKEIEEPYLSNVKKMHEIGLEGGKGWGYSFDKDFTRRLVLRSQGTAVSSETLKNAEVPSRYFGILRCFRVDKVDATHLSDFYQTEGIVVSPNVNIKTLLSYLEIFAKEIAGAKEVKYVPGYFPFTEPSIEVHVKHPVLGWFELGGAGIFRKEVTEPQGVKVPVLAWGLGIDRMALMHLGLNDLRELFTMNLEAVRGRKAF